MSCQFCSSPVWAKAAFGRICGAVGTMKAALLQPLTASEMRTSGSRLWDSVSTIPAAFGPSTHCCRITQGGRCCTSCNLAWEMTALTRAKRSGFPATALSGHCWTSVGLCSHQRPYGLEWAMAHGIKMIGRSSRSWTAMATPTSVAVELMPLAPSSGRTQAIMVKFPFLV